MENVTGPLIKMFTDDPVNWVKWAVVFTVLIGFFILAFKIYSKIEYRLSIQKKADDARAKGHVIPGAKRISVHEKRSRSERNGEETTYSGTYKYMLDGKEKEYRAFFDTNYPPKEIDLYYKNSPRKLFSVEEYYWRAHIGILYLSLIFMPFVLAGFTAMALDIPFATGSDDKGSAEVVETGAWKEGTIIDGYYYVTITCPEVGHPDSESEWRTSYTDPREELELDIKFNFADAIPPKGEYLQGETQLWGHTMVYEERETQNRVREDREQDLFVGFLELGPDMYLQIEIMGVSEVNTPAYMFLEDENFQNCFRLEWEVIQ